jgi:hypothetical protein
VTARRHRLLRVDADGDEIVDTDAIFDRTAESIERHLLHPDVRLAPRTSGGAATYRKYDGEAPAPADCCESIA